MSIGYIMAQERGAADLALAQTVDLLTCDGLRLAGLVQTNTEHAKDHPCDMDVRVLPEGQVFRISQRLGASARGCRLNPDALETAVALVDSTLAALPQVLVLNKFGKHEAEGRGFRATIGAALAQGVPVLLGVNGLNREAFLAFAGEFAQELPADPAALVAWVKATVQAAETAS